MSVLAWVKSVVGEAIYAPAEGPRPERPYATVELLSDRAVGAPDTQTGGEPDEDGLFEHTISSHRRGTLSVSIYADNHRELAEALELSLHGPSAQELLKASGVVVVGMAAGVGYNRVIRPTSFERFSVIDFEFGRVAALTERVAVIETVEVTRDE